MIDITQIDTRIGTKNSYKFSHGNTLPLTGTPFAMNYLSVQTNNDNSWWFDPDAHTFAGIRLTHQPSPWIGDFQHFIFKFKTRSFEKLSELDDYSPKTSIFRPDYLKLDNISQQLRILATANKFGGVIKANNFGNNSIKLIIQTVGSIELEKHNQIFVFKTQNFAACADPDFSMWTAITAKNLNYEKTINEDKISALVFSIANQAELVFATSFINPAQAIYNLKKQVNFDQTNYQAIHIWNNYLNKIQIQDYNLNKVKTFYANMYRSFLFPMQFYEINSTGDAIHYSTTLKKIMPGKMYTNIGFWDVYRTNFPLYSLLCPKKYADFLAGFYNHYLETGFLPRWLSPDERGMMPGTMLDVIIADAAVKGIATKKMPKYFKAMVKAAETSSKDSKYGREGLEEYRTLGYVSTNYPESVNKTLDYAYSDWAISVVANVIGESQIAEYYAKRSLNYKNLFNLKLGLMVPKDKHGNFISNFKKLDWGNGFTEGSAWQNSFNVYQDIPGLINLFGNSDKFINTLIKLVNQNPIYNVGSYEQIIHEMREMAAQPFGQLAISNQPSFHIPYLFALAGKPHYTEILIKQLLSIFNYTDTGYPGDEDNGSMSSWYLWSALGLYPEAAGKGSYIFGIPSFDEVKINLDNDQTLLLITENNDPTKQFVAKRTFNQQKCQNTISHADLIKGGVLQVKLSLLPE